MFIPNLQKYQPKTIQKKIKCHEKRKPIELSFMIP